MEMLVRAGAVAEPCIICQVQHPPWRGAALPYSAGENDFVANKRDKRWNIGRNRQPGTTARLETAAHTGELFEAD